MSATMRNPARDLKDMPAFHATSPNGRIQAHGNLRDVREVPHIPQLPPSPPSRRAIRRKASMSPLVSNAGVGKPRRASRSRASPSPISPLRAHNAGSYSEVRKAAHLQRQIEVRRRRELYEDCERLLASRRYTKDELLHHRLILQLPERERERLFLEHEARVRLRDPQADKRRKGWEEKYDEYRLQQKRKSRCNVM
ncbi:hypothetical protein A1O3_01384 [Capronia epimyces CBS 606.96]|uniref:Uncharacterized protein n=1 Tax=Capronia epimyces CBS 606.96 TaxID=1182542 RepID=W9YT48_9EURO|nr:uncharacterized protein A1O3_01384 [Capronia epimyces CBS 606.96]EXJ92830.1 hypothetical protein A1O3_01384 [Capronia epimyces CBS 606.96]